MELYLYGSEKPGANGKLHIADDTGKPLCQTKIRFGECTAVAKFVDGILYSNDFLKSQMRSRWDVVYLWNTHKCTKCEKKVKKLLDM